MTTSAYISSLKLIHKVMIAAVIVFTCIAGFMVLGNGAVKANASSMHTILKFVAPAVFLFSVLGSAAIYKSKLEQILNNKSFSLTDKLTNYRTVTISRYALLEFGILFNTIAMLLTGSNYYIIFIVLLLVVFVLYAPSREQIAIHLQLNQEEQLNFFDEYAELN